MNETYYGTFYHDNEVYYGETDKEDSYAEDDATPWMDASVSGAKTIASAVVALIATALMF